jgi:hypothetical protein
MIDNLEKCVRAICDRTPTGFFIHRNSGYIRGYCETHYRENYPYQAEVKGWDVITRDEAIAYSIMGS